MVTRNSLGGKLKGKNKIYASRLSVVENFIRANHEILYAYKKNKICQKKKKKIEIVIWRLLFIRSKKRNELVDKLMNNYATETKR